MRQIELAGRQSLAADLRKRRPRCLVGEEGEGTLAAQMNGATMTAEIGPGQASLSAHWRAPLSTKWQWQWQGAAMTMTTTKGTRCGRLDFMYR